MSSAAEIMTEHLQYDVPEGSIMLTPSFHQLHRYRVVRVDTKTNSKAIVGMFASLECAARSAMYYIRDGRNLDGRMDYYVADSQSDMIWDMIGQLRDFSTQLPEPIDFLKL